MCINVSPHFLNTYIYIYMYNFSWAALLHVSCYVAPSGSLGRSMFVSNFHAICSKLCQHMLVNMAYGALTMWIFLRTETRTRSSTFPKTIQTCTVDISILVAACIVSLMNVTLFVCLDFCGCVIVAGFDEHTVHFAIFPTWWICV